MEVSSVKGIKLSAAPKNCNTASSAAPEIKAADKSSLEALEAMGRASLNLSGISFKGSIVSSSSSTEMSDKEFERLEKEFYEKLDSMPDDIQESFRCGRVCALTKYSINFAFKILNMPFMLKHKYFMYYAARMVSNVRSPESRELASMILSTPKLYKNELVMNNAGYMLSGVRDSESQKIASMILSTPKFYKNKHVMNNAGSIIRVSKTPEQQKLALEIFNHPKLAEYAGKIAFECSAEAFPEDLNTIKKLAEKVKKGLEPYEAARLALIYKFINSDLSGLIGHKKAKIFQSAELLLRYAQPEHKSIISRVKALIFKNADIFSESEKNEIKEFASRLAQSMKHTITPSAVTEKDTASMMTGFFANNNPQLEKFISSFDFTRFGKTGIPLKYSRKAFLSDLTKMLKNIPENQQNDLFKKLEIAPAKAENGEITGYNGIINLSALKNDGIEGQVQALIERFIKRNSADTGNKELNSLINALIKGMPEFINIIGKEHHRPHEYSIDTHILTVLKEAMSNPEYKKLSGIDKTCLKFAVIMHDIAKQEGIADANHPNTSALYARNIMEKYPFPASIKDRIFELIKNHHWLAEYNTGEADADEIAARFRHKDDFTIARIMAEADLKGVSESFYNSHKAALKPENLEPAAAALEKINQTGQLVFTSRIIRPGLIPEQEYQGAKYKVLNFTKIDDNEDLSKYGFAPGTTKESLRLYAHMASNAANLETASLLSDIANGGFLCTTYLSPKNKATHHGSEFGVSLECENVNIANAAPINQSSGGHKGYKDFVNYITGINKHLYSYRQDYADSLKQNLKLTDEEYSELYQLISPLEYITQIRDDKTYKIGSKTLKGSEIKNAVQKTEDKLISGMNESNLYNPKINAFIAKVNSIEEIPQEFLDFIQKHNLPVYLLGNK